MEKFSLEGLKKDLRDHLKKLDVEARMVRSALRALEGSEPEKKQKTATPPKKRRQIKIKSYRELILKYLADHETVSSREIASMVTGASQTAASRELKKMLGESLLESAGTGPSGTKLYRFPVKEEVVEGTTSTVLHLSTAGFSKQEQRLIQEGERKLAFTTEQPA